MKRWGGRRMARTLACALAAAALTSCAADRSTVSPEGRLPVLGPGPAFAVSHGNDGWIIEGDRGAVERRVRVTTLTGVPALRVTSGQESFILVRATDAHLLATPYLSWAWNMEDPGDRVHPIGLVVGFAGGNREPPSWARQQLSRIGTALPRHDRMLLLTWGRTALERGSLLAPQDPIHGAPSYRPRGGSENALNWWLETADLASLYTQSWPDDRINMVRVSFIGVAAASDHPAGRPVAGHISGILLSR
jgi:hypothetical protein